MTNETKEFLWEKFIALGKNALKMSHYDLADAVEDTTLIEWREFLNEPDVEEYAKKEMRLITDAIQKQMITDIVEGGDKSVGRAQIINTLDKLNGVETLKEGPVFIYTYVPLDKNQEQAMNIQKLSNDVFIRSK